MTPAITLDEAKLYLRVDHDEEDGLIEGFISAAFEKCADHIGCPLPDPVPLTIRQAAFFLIGHYYVNRSAISVAVSAAELPLAVENLLDPHRAQPFT